MRKRNSILEFTFDRQRDLIRVYRHLLRGKTHITTDIYREVAESRSSRFWVSEERAFSVIKAMMEGRPPSGMRPLKMEMFQEILKRVERILHHFPEKSLISAIERVIYSPAPKFYLDPDTVRIYIGRIKRQNQSDKYDCKRTAED